MLVSTVSSASLQPAKTKPSFGGTTEGSGAVAAWPAATVCTATPGSGSPFSSQNVTV